MTLDASSGEVVGIYREPPSPRRWPQRRDPNTAAHWCRDPPCVFHDEAHDAVANHETIRIVAIVCVSWQRHGPVGKLESQRVPSFAPPPLGDSPSLQEYVLSSQLAEVVAHGQPRLPSANDHRFNVIQPCAWRLALLIGEAARTDLPIPLKVGQTASSTTASLLDWHYSALRPIAAIQTSTLRARRE